MGVGDRQRLITSIVATVLEEPARTDMTFDWFKNRHTQEDFGDRYAVIDSIFKAIGGDSLQNSTKAVRSLDCDAYFGGKWNFMFEFDEFQHFSTARQRSLELYPSDLKLTVDTKQYMMLCKVNKGKADKYRESKVTADFNFRGGRTAQRAYFDCFRDLLPDRHGLNPTLRITEFEVASVHGNTEQGQAVVREIVSEKLSRVGLWPVGNRV